MELLGLKGIRKHFPSTGTLAVDGADFSVRRGEVHALVGENGAGKSTLARIMCGLEKPDAGTLMVRGSLTRFASHRDAERLGIGIVPQYSMLAGNLSAAENIALGHEPLLAGIFYDQKKAAYDLALLCGRYGFSLDPNVPVSTLPNAQRREAEILRALARGADVLILDEPTSILAEHETEALFALIRRLTAAGAGIVYISHRSKEILNLADRITVMRDGRVVQTLPAAGLEECDLADLIVRANACALDAGSGSQPGQTVLQLRDVSMKAPSGSAFDAIQDLNLVVRAGEVVGVVALGGNGLDVLEDLASGLIPPDRGEILIHGRPMAGLDARQLRTALMAYLPTDRDQRGLCGTTRVKDNLVAKRLQTYSFISFARGVEPDKDADQLLASFGIKGSTSQMVPTLSGGNKQRLVAARELDGARPVVLAANPAQGLDMAARTLLFQRLRSARDDGAAVLLLSSDPEDLADLADRSFALYRGRLFPVESGHLHGGGLASILTGGHS
jgi:simple sugar transport system ATP-binding protein